MRARRQLRNERQKVPAHRNRRPRRLFLLCKTPRRSLRLRRNQHPCPNHRRTPSRSPPPLHPPLCRSRLRRRPPRNHPSIPRITPAQRIRTIAPISRRRLRRRPSTTNAAASQMTSTSSTRTRTAIRATACREGHGAEACSRRPEHDLIGHFEVTSTAPSLPAPLSAARCSLDDYSQRLLVPQHLVDQLLRLLRPARYVCCDASGDDARVIAAFVEGISHEKHILLIGLQFLREPFDAECLAHAFADDVDRRLAADEDFVAGQLLLERVAELRAFDHLRVPRALLRLRGVIFERRERDGRLAINDTIQLLFAVEDIRLLHRFLDGLRDAGTFVFAQRETIGGFPACALPHVATSGIIGKHVEVRRVVLVWHALQDIPFDAREGRARHDRDRESLGQCEYLLKDLGCRRLEALSERVVEVEDDGARRRGFRHRPHPFHAFAHLHEERDHRNRDDRKHDERDVLLDVGDHRAEEVSAERESATPDYGAEDVIEQERLVPHPRDAREDGDECTYDGDEASEEDRLGSVFVEEKFRLCQVRLLEETRITAAIERGTDPCAEPIADGISQDRCDEDRREKDVDVEISLRCQESCGEKKGTTRQRDAEEDPGFGEHDREDARISDRLDYLNEINPEKHLWSMLHFWLITKRFWLPI